MVIYIYCFNVVIYVLYISSKFHGDWNLISSKVNNKIECAQVIGISLLFDALASTVLRQYIHMINSLQNFLACSKFGLP